MIRKICEFSLSLNDVHRPDWSTTMPADLVDVSVLSQDGRLRSASSSSVSQFVFCFCFFILSLILIALVA